MSLGLIQIHLSTEQDTISLAQRLSAILSKGDCILLEGPIGSGKSSFARALIRHLLGQSTDVPSPTFTLVQTYEHPNFDIWHCDLYRLTDPDEVLELGLDLAFEDALCLIEWPDRLGSETPVDALLMTFAAEEKSHKVTISANASWQSRIVHIDG